MGIIWALFVFTYLGVALAGSSLVVFYIIYYKLFSAKLIMSGFLSSIVFIVALNPYAEDIISDSRGTEYAMMQVLIDGFIHKIPAGLFIAIFLTFIWRKSELLVGISLGLCITSFWWFVRLNSV